MSGHGPARKKWGEVPWKTGNDTEGEGNSGGDHTERQAVEVLSYV